MIYSLTGLQQILWETVPHKLVALWPYPRVMQASLTTWERRSLADSLKAASMSRSCCRNPSNSAAPARSSERTFFSWRNIAREETVIIKDIFDTSRWVERKVRMSYSRHSELPVLLIIWQHVSNLCHGLLHFPVRVDLMESRKDGWEETNHAH